MKQGVALADVALVSAGAGKHLVASVDGRALQHADWVRMVRGWHAAFARVSGDEVAFYFEDALDFSAALWGAWHAGKTPVLLSDVQPSTLEQLLPTVSATAGLLPRALTALDVLEEQPLPPFDMHSAQLVLFTSGSTGKPERIVKKVRQLDAEVHALQAAFGSAFGGVVAADSLQVLATVSHQHIYGLLFRVLWPLSAGREIGTRFARYPEEVLQQLSQAEHNVLISSPAMLSRLPDHLLWGDARTRLKAVFSSGGPLAAQGSELALSTLGHSPTEVFGSSETGGIAWRRRAEHGDVWQTLPGIEVRLNDSGLLAVRSGHLVDPANWWETADRAEPLNGGASFVLQGRADRIVKIAEKRVSLTAMEQRLQAHEFVKLARAVLIERANLPTRVGMVLELSEAGWQALFAQGRQTMGQVLRDWLADVVERVALPRSWRYVVCMPMNEQSKITQQSLLALFDPLMPALQWVSRTELEAHVQLQVVPALRVLEGHFPQAKLIPGVAQLHWAVMLARQAFDIPGVYARAEVVKFQQPILPGDTVEVQLKRIIEKDAIQFAFTSRRGAHASGRLLKGA
ncbi:AMP-binding protein [Diaphorobacter sp. HDW4B]|uniref:AMP-binding protein n=1 Tax=Diaphorobacter sp. HDW4B TaxID=2714925 RepID=UPI001407C3E3|nr:AMP-binding protein [Diaphorobacter sp. HDW4B]QIL69324.1 AMP-binding protein [Diaphorobacter sp. HDW4B]